MNTNRKVPKLDLQSREKLSKKLNLLCKYLNDEYSINFGGCCYVAYLMASLLKHDGIKYKVIVFDSENFCKRKTFIEDPWDHTHYCIQVDNYLINEDNCEGLYKVVYKRVTPKDLKKHYFRSSWNDTYDVTNNSFIEKIIRTSYEKFKKSLSKV